MLLRFSRTACCGCRGLYQIPNTFWEAFTPGGDDSVEALD